MKQSWLVPSAILVGAFIFMGCRGEPTPPSASEQATLASETSASLDAFNNEDPSLKALLAKSNGYAIFPEVGKAGFIAGGSYGKGEVFENGGKVGYADITQATFGLQAGAQTFGELIVFLRPQELQDFKASKFSVTGNLSAVAIKSGAAESSDTSKGVVIFVHAKGGLMAEASVGGQRFRYQPIK